MIDDEWSGCFPMEAFFSLLFFFLLPVETSRVDTQDSCLPRACDASLPMNRPACLSHPQEWHGEGGHMMTDGRGKWKGMRGMGEGRGGGREGMERKGKEKNTYVAS